MAISTLTSCNTLKSINLSTLSARLMQEPNLKRRRGFLPVRLTKLSISPSTTMNKKEIRSKISRPSPRVSFKMTCHVCQFRPLPQRIISSAANSLNIRLWQSQNLNKVKQAPARWGIENVESPRSPARRATPVALNHTSHRSLSLHKAICLRRGRRLSGAAPRFTLALWAHRENLSSVESTIMWYSRA